MTVTGLKVMTKRWETDEGKVHCNITIADGETVDVCRTSDPSTIDLLEQMSMGEQVTLCVTQSVYKDKVYNTIVKILD